MTAVARAGCTEMCLRRLRLGDARRAADHGRASMPHKGPRLMKTGAAWCRRIVSAIDIDLDEQVERQLEPYERWRTDVWPTPARSICRDTVVAACRGRIRNSTGFHELGNGRLSDTHMLISAETQY